MTKVLVADDQSLIREALSAMLSLEDDLDVVAQVGTCAGVVKAAAQYQPDVVLLDVQMPAGELDINDGIDVINSLLHAAPQCKVIVVTTFGRPGYLRRALEAGAVGFMVKDAPADQLIEGIRRAAVGLRVVDPELATTSLSVGPSPLTQKEEEVLTAATGGASTRQIAAVVHLTEGTVRNYLSSAMGKLRARNRAEAIRVATENGWL